jgi:hypothetical protein
VEIAGIDLASLPWPVALLVLVLIGISIFINFVYIPLVDEVNRLKKIEEEEIVGIKNIVTHFETLITNVLSEFNFDEKITGSLQTIKNENENRFEAVNSLLNEIIKVNHESNSIFTNFDNSFKDKIRTELKDMKDFNKEYFINIVSILGTTERTLQSVSSDISNLEDEFKNFINTLTSNQRNIEQIKEKMNMQYNQLESIKEKIQLITMNISRSSLGS